MSKHPPKPSWLAQAPSKETLHRYPEYWRLVEWHATPSPSRFPKTLGELAKELGIHANTIPRWKLASCFFDDVSNAVKHAKRDNLANVITAIENMIFKGDGGAASAAKIWLEWTGEHTPKLQIEHSGNVQHETVENPIISAIVKHAESEFIKALSRKDPSRIPANGRPRTAQPVMPALDKPKKAEERKG